ncbi:MAG: hypothetical protein OXU29_08505 [Gammaproteobacteria bacterium]|nr:hypothetical protein [Gammaproteobacteria bacterium]
MPTDENRRLNRETLRMAAKYNELNALLNSMVPYLTADKNANAKRLGVSEEQLDALTDQQSAWETAYARYLDPNTRTRAVVMQMEKIYQATMEMVRTLQQQIKNNAEVTLTGDDHTALGIHKDKETRTRVPVQTVPPVVTVHVIMPRQTTFRAIYPDSRGDAHRRMPAYNSVMFKVAYTAAGAPAPAEEAYDHIGMSGRTVFTVVAPDNTPAGAQGFIKCCYVNSRGEAGPDSEPVKFIVN